MNKAIFFTCFCFGILIQQNAAQQPDGAQSTWNTKKVKYQVWVYSKSNTTFMGSLYQTGDSSIVVAATKKQFYSNTTALEQFPVNQINELKIRKRGQVGKGALIGVGSGILLGALVGRLSYTPCDNCFLDFGPGFSTMGGAILGIPVGALVGIAAGSVRSSYPISGKQSNYASQREKLKQFSITGQ